MAVILTLNEAADLLKVGVKTAEKLARENVIPARKVGREWRFLDTMLMDWLAGGDVAIDEKLEAIPAKNVVSFSAGAKANTAKAYQDALGTKSKKSN